LYQQILKYTHLYDGHQLSESYYNLWTLLTAPGKPLISFPEHTDLLNKAVLLGNKSAELKQYEIISSEECPKYFSTKLFSFHKNCMDRSIFAKAAIESGARLINEDKDRQTDTFDSSKLLDGSETLIAN